MTKCFSNDPMTNELMAKCFPNPKCRPGGAMKKVERIQPEQVLT